MNVIQFIDSRKSGWTELEKLVKSFRDGGTFTQKDFRQLTLLYRSAASDFAYAGTHYPEHDVHHYLNKLVAGCHGILYQSPKVRLGDFGSWFTRTVPGIFWNNGKVFIFSLSIFLFFGAIGFLGSEYVPEGEKVFFRFSLLNPQGAFSSSSDYIHSCETNIKKGRPFWQYENESNFYLSGRIFNQNIMVAMVFCFLGGLLGGIITFWSLATMGMMMGAFFHIYYRHSLSLDFWNTVMIHGTIELTMLVIASTCGFMVGGAMLFPGDRTRGEALRVKGVESVQVGLAMCLWLVVAGFFEGYVTGARLPWAAKLTINLSCLAALILYWGVLGFLGRKSKSTA